MVSVRATLVTVGEESAATGDRGRLDWRARSTEVHGGSVSKICVGLLRRRPRSDWRGHVCKRM